MKAFNDYDKVQTLSERPELPIGAYECIIIGAEERTFEGQNGTFSQLYIAIDINAGEYKGFYANDYQINKRSNEDAKWKGILKLYIPVDDGSDKDNLTKSIFKTATTAIEDSNNGYHWDWNEKGLKGKKVGCVFRNEQWVYNDKQGWKAQPFKFISLDDLANGKFKIPQPKPHKDAIYNEPAPNSNITNDIGSFEEIDDDEEVPFL